MIDDVCDNPHTIIGPIGTFSGYQSTDFVGVLAKDLVVLYPSRVAAQIVSGIGFIGGGISEELRQCITPPSQFQRYRTRTTIMTTEARLKGHLSRP